MGQANIFREIVEKAISGFNHVLFSCFEIFESFTIQYNF